MNRLVAVSLPKPPIIWHILKSGRTILHDGNLRTRPLATSSSTSIAGRLHRKMENGGGRRALGYHPATLIHQGKNGNMRTVAPFWNSPSMSSSMAGSYRSSSFIIHTAPRTHRDYSSTPPSFQKSRGGPKPPKPRAARRWKEALSAATNNHSNHNHRRKIPTKKATVMNIATKNKRVRKISDMGQPTRGWTVGKSRGIRAAVRGSHRSTNRVATLALENTASAMTHNDDDEEDAPPPGRRNKRKSILHDTSNRKEQRGKTKLSTTNNDYEEFGDEDGNDDGPPSKRRNKVHRSNTNEEQLHHNLSSQRRTKKPRWKVRASSDKDTTNASSPRKGERTFNTFTLNNDEEGAEEGWSHEHTTSKKKQKQRPKNTKTNKGNIPRPAPQQQHYNGPFVLFVSCLPGLEKILYQEIVHLKGQWQSITMMEHSSSSDDSHGYVHYHEEEDKGMKKISNRSKHVNVNIYRPPRILPGGVQLTVPTLCHLYILHLYLGTASHIYWRLNDGMIHRGDDGSHTGARKTNAKDGQNDDFSYDEYYYLVPDKNDDNDDNNDDWAEYDDGKKTLGEVAIPPLFRARNFPELQRKLKELISQNGDAWLIRPSPRSDVGAKKTSKQASTKKKYPPWRLQVRVTSSKSKLMHTKAIEERVRSAIGEVMCVDLDAAGIVGGSNSNSNNGTSNSKETNGEDDDDDSPILRLLVRIDRDMVQLSIDTTSSSTTAAIPMHRRGYRLETSKAPLREDLAYALLLAGGITPNWDLLPLKSFLVKKNKNGPLKGGSLEEERDDETTMDTTLPAPSVQLLDPFCGSGTIAIEGAAILANLPPGRFRPPPLQGTRLCKPRLWEAMKLRAISASALGREVVPNNAEMSCSDRHVNESERKMFVSASDRDNGAIKAARANAERAGVGRFIDFRCGPFGSHPWLKPLSAAGGDSRHAPSNHLSESPTPPPSLSALHIISNPPYGLRLSSNEALPLLYQKLGHLLSSLSPAAPATFSNNQHQNLHHSRNIQYAIIGSNPRFLRKMGLPLDVAFSTKHGGLNVVAMTNAINSD